jgi:hypothetical protein
LTPLSIDAPMASLLACAQLTYKALGARREPPVGQPAVSHAVRLGDRIELATLAAYARAAGYVLWMEASLPERVGCRAVLFHRARADGLDVSVADARGLYAAIGLDMTLAVEPVEGSERSSSGSSASRSLRVKC